jgi:hypothetical protein
VVLLQSGVQELKKITSRCAEAAPQLAASFISGPSPLCCLLAGADEVIELSDDFRYWHFSGIRASVWDRMGSLYSCFYQTEKRKIFRNRAGQTNG